MSCDYANHLQKNEESCSGRCSDALFRGPIPVFSVLKAPEIKEILNTLKRLMGVNNSFFSL
jgi:hypothetical protein